MPFYRLTELRPGVFQCAEASVLTREKLADQRAAATCRSCRAAIGAEPHVLVNNQPYHERCVFRREVAR